MLKKTDNCNQTFLKRIADAKKEHSKEVLKMFQVHS